MKHHKSELKSGWGSGLDPKRAQAFNYTTVHEHFTLIKATIEEHKILWRNIYNIDEKGVQMGSGRKGTRTKYFFSRDDKMKYKLQSDDLQLVTIIEAICVHGKAEIGPGFVFPGTTKHSKWFDETDMKYTWVVVAEINLNSLKLQVGLELLQMGGPMMRLGSSGSRLFVPQATEQNRWATKQEEAEKRNCDQSMINDEELNLPSILLIYDGHGSHTTLSWIDHARTNNMILYWDRKSVV